MATLATIPISHFKARCLAILAEVERTGKPVRVTKRGKPVADVVPAGVHDQPKRVAGCMRGTVKILGDIVGPIGGPEDWGDLWG